MRSGRRPAGGILVAIPPRIAHELCEEVRKEKAEHLFTQCWGCVRFAKGDERKFCYNSRSDLRGCGLINRRYDEGPASPREARAAG